MNQNFKVDERLAAARLLHEMMTTAVPVHKRILKQTVPEISNDEALARLFEETHEVK